ncbi:hypothetical protein B0H21DRAFT_842799 [Amylocystis lapponica]|nr:hypothetical protein B0H21DRAFT_842799 [Amylocystis lapponica]
MQNVETSEIFHTSAYLVGSSSSESASDLREVLQRRLAQYYASSGRDVDELPGDASLEDVQLATAKAALNVVELLQNKWARDSSSDVTEAKARDAQNPPGAGPSPADDAVGTRDMAQLRTLISIVFKWAVDPLLARVVAAIPTRTAPRIHGGAKIIDLTGAPDNYATLTSYMNRFQRLLLPDGVNSPLTRTIITSTVLVRHLADLLRPCITLGWLPKSLSTDSVHTLDALRPLVIYLLSILPASQTIAALGSILSDAPSSLPYVRKSCGFLLSKQLLRQEGVAGLLAVVFGEEDVSGDDAPLEKLEHVGRLLSALPANMKPEEYYGVIIPRLISMLSADPRMVPQAHKRAVAFSLSRMFAADSSSGSSGFVSSILLPILHLPFLRPTPVFSDDNDAHEVMTPVASLITLQTLLTNADPSPTFVSSLLTPIIPPLYAVLFELETTKTSDPTAKESVKGFLATWGRLVGASEGIETLWRIVDGEGGEWQTDVAGNLTRAEKSNRASSLALFTPDDLRRAQESGEFDVDSNLLNLRPDPVRFSRYLKSIERTDISSELFVRLLEAYREVKSDPEADPLRTLLYLQLIVQMQTQLSSDGSSAGILSKPGHMLSFIKHALDSATSPNSGLTQKPVQRTENGLRMEDLRIVPEEEEGLEDTDSDDEESDSHLGEAGDQEMVVTAVNLLLSILEANPDLSARSAPILNDIFSLLEPLAKDAPDALRPLAREARMVMTARLASTSAPSSKARAKRTDDEESAQETYQKALKLLQDPLLPVRAHGLLLLRQLVAARRSQSGALGAPALDRALVPAILAIFLQSVQDDDSYMFLNAVQGLAAMVDGFGRDVLRGLVGVYVDGLDGIGGSALTQQDVDMRTRVGEALGQVIRRCGGALAAYVDVLVPPLFGVVRTAHFPTTLRTSAISLLAQSVQTSALAILPYTVDLSGAMIDLLQVETVPVARRQATSSEPSKKGGTGAATIDPQATSTNTKLPPLRRAALHFLSLLIRAWISQVYDSAGAEEVPFAPDVVRRAKNTLGYVAGTDEDGVVRAMAREALEGLEQLECAMVGL